MAETNPVERIHQAVKPAALLHLELLPELRKRRLLQGKAARILRLGVHPKHLGCFRDCIASAAKHQPQQPFDQPHDATRARNCASVMW